MLSLEEALRDWEPVIGLEVHCALTALETKLFCGCKVEFGAEPNSHTCPVCLGLPGALPVPNKAAVESAVLAGIALDCDVKKRSMFYRKGYLYPDLAKGFQITQGAVAFCEDGHLDLRVDDESARESACLPGMPKGAYTTRIGIARIHLEEDAGKMVHIGGGEGRITGATHSLVDYNRAGTPLIELVTRPDLRTPEEARLFMQKLRQVLLALGISDCSMEKGSLRADGNISLRRRGTAELGTKTELKNINSFKFLHDALAFEVRRQAEVLEAGGTIRQETRHWDPVAKRTVVMRVKETADDYRMFPDPDLAPFDLSEAFVERVRKRLPELPDRKAERFAAAFGLPDADARFLAERPDYAVFFEACMAEAADAAPRLGRRVANLLINDVAGPVSAASPLTPARAVELAGLFAEGVLSSNQLTEVLAVVLREDKDPAAVVAERGLAQVTDAGVITSVVDDVLAAHPAQVELYRGGKTGVLGFFIGQCMKVMNGRGNPKLIREVLAQKLALD